MTSLRKAKKALRSRAARGEALGVEEVLALPPVRGIPRPVPCPPNPAGRNLVPAGYVGWVLITTPKRRRKVRWLAGDGRVYRDDHCRRGGFYRLEVHASACTVQPCDVVPLGGHAAHIAAAWPKLDDDVRSLQATAGVLGGRPGGRLSLQERAHERMLAAGLPGPDPSITECIVGEMRSLQAAMIWPAARRGVRS